MKKLNRRGYLTIEIILGSVIAFAIAFFLIEITAKMISNNNDTFRDTIITTDNALIISGVKSEIEIKSTDTGVSEIECNNNSCDIKFADNSNGKLYISKDDNLKINKIVYEMNNVITYQKELDSSLSDIKLTSNITGEVADKYIYFKITSKNIFLDKEYNIIIPIDNFYPPLDQTTPAGI